MSRLALAGAGLGAVVVVAAPWLLTTVFGAPYLASVTALRWLIVATLCLYLAISGGYLLMAVGRARDNVVAVGAAAAANVALNLILIPSRGIDGAAMATAASFAIMLGITVVAVERSFAAAHPMVTAA